MATDPRPCGECGTVEASPEHVPDGHFGGCHEYRPATDEEWDSWAERAAGAYDPDWTGDAISRPLPCRECGHNPCVYPCAPDDRHERIAEAAKLFPPEVVDALVACPVDGPCPHNDAERGKIARRPSAGPRRF